MANAMYDKGFEALLAQLLTDNIKVALVKSTYAVSLTGHQFYSDISAHVVGTPVALASKAMVAGSFDAADATITAPAAGNTIIAVVLYKDTGVDATSPIYLYIDTVTGFPFVTGGGDVVLRWDNGALRIFGV